MNRYPLWKNLMMLGVVLVGIVLALPNVFGDDVAIFISRSDGAAVPQSMIASITDTLQKADIAIKGADIENKAALVRFPNVDQQLRGEAVLEKALPDYVVALTLSPRTPGWLRAIGLKPMALGLDLRGGVHFVYQVDLNAAIQQYLANYETDLRTQLRQANIRNDVRVMGDALQVSVLESKDAMRAEEIVRKLDSGDQVLQLGKATGRLDIQNTEVDGKPGFTVRLSQAALKERQDFAIQQNTVTLRNRVNELGVSEAVVQRQGLDRILVELPGVQNPAEAKRVLGSTATLEFHLVDQENDPYEAQRRGRPPLGDELKIMKDGKTPILLHRDVIASGDQLVDASFQYSQGMPAVFVRLDAAGARKMLDTTSQNVGRNMAVLYIEEKPQTVVKNGERVAAEPKREEKVINNARINGVFSNRFQITGLTPFEGNELALLLRSGSLAAPITPVDERTIGPSLGQDNIDRGVRSAIVGYLLVVGFITLYYRMFGLLADITLFVNVVLLVAVMSVIHSALTLPGIAGIVLTVGMAVDANVLIFERIREEVNNGNTPQASIRAGFEKAFSTILDSQLTTLIAAIVLWMFGTGPIRGFAVTMSIGIITSLFTSVTLTRALVNLVYGGRTNLKQLSIGVRPPNLAATKASA